MAQQATRRTTELRLGGAVLFSDTPTGRALTAGIARINCDDSDPGQDRFVVYERPELPKSPGVQNRPLVAASRYSGADTLQVFQGNSPSSALRNGDYAFTETMVDISGEPPLLTGKNFQSATRGFRAFLLQFLAQASVAIPNSLDGLSRKDFTIACSGNVTNPKVNSQESVDVYGIRFFDIADRQQVKLTFTKNQITFALTIKQHKSLAFAAYVGDFLASLSSPDRHTVRIPPEYAVIEGNTPERTERPFGFPVELVSIGHFRNAADDDLSSEIEVFFDPVVSQTVQGKFTEGFVFPGCFADSIAGRVCPLQSFDQGSVLFGGGC